MITFSRISDEVWGIRSDNGPLTAGDRVIVSRKDGTEVPVTVGRVLWTRGEVSLAEIDRSGAGGSGGSGGSGGGRAASAGRRKAAKPAAPPPPPPPVEDDIVF